MFIYPYMRGSNSCKLLKEQLNIKCIKLVNSRFKGKKEKLIINWGCSKLSDEAMKCNILNHPDNIPNAIDKRKFFELTGELSVPYTLSKEEATEWLKKSKVVVRHVVNGYGGNGIEIIEEGNLPDAPLYTKYIPKDEEYRLHVFQGKVFFVQRKARRKDVPDDLVNWKVRNLAGGFIFASQNVDVPEIAKEAAIVIQQKLKLDFCAIDMIYNKKSDKWYALEANTAPGICGVTLEKYVEQFRGLK